MLISTSFIISLFAAASVTIVEPVDGETYNGDWLPFRAIVENENELPDSVVYSLNGGPSAAVPRLNTDWPTYMQNNLNIGFSESPAPMTNEVLWTAPLCDTLHVFENPIVADGCVYHLGIGKLFALDAGTGSEIWNYTVGAHDDPPTFLDGRLYLASDSIYCIDAAAGSRIWAVFGADCNGGTPCVMDGKIACATGGFISNTVVFCLAVDDGQVLWQRELAGGIGNCMAGWNGFFFVGTHEGALNALDAETGDVVWSHTITEGGYWDTSPTIVDGKIYIGGMDGAVHRFDALTGELEWETTISEVSVEPTPALFGDMVICGSTGNLINPGSLTALSREDGTVVWSIPNSIHGSAAVADDVVFWGGYCEPYDLVYAADAATGEILWEYDPNAGPWGLQCTPSITDGVMYFGCTDGNLYAFGTGLKYTYKEDCFYADVGSNELIVTSWDNGVVIAADTINFTVTQTGTTLGPSRLLHLSASPNPFKSGTSISFELEEPCLVSMQIFDLAGRTITILVGQEIFQGEHSLQWNGCNENGEPVSAGLYLCRIECEGIVESIGLCLLK